MRPIRPATWTYTNVTDTVARWLAQRWPPSDGGVGARAHGEGQVADGHGLGGGRGRLGGRGAVRVSSLLRDAGAVSGRVWKHGRERRDDAHAKAIHVRVCALAAGRS